MEEVGLDEDPGRVGTKFEGWSAAARERARAKAGDTTPLAQESGALPCPNKRFPCVKHCKVMNGPSGKGCKKELDACDAHWKGTQPTKLPKHDPKYFGFVAPSYDCQMAKCLARCQRNGHCSTSLGSVGHPKPLALCTNKCLSDHLLKDHHNVYADAFGDAPDSNLHACMMKRYFDPRPPYGCPNKRFPCKDRCDIMHNKCAKELAACDKSTKPGGFRSNGRCELTVCFSKCGCGHNPSGQSMACHDKCLKTHNNPGDIALKTCVFKNTKWIQNITRQQAISR